MPLVQEELIPKIGCRAEANSEASGSVVVTGSPATLGRRGDNTPQLMIADVESEFLLMMNKMNSTTQQRDSPANFGHSGISNHEKSLTFVEHLG